MYFPVYHAVALKLAQLMGDHVLGGFWHHAPKLPETKHAAPKVVKDGNFVFSTDNIKGGIDRRIIAGLGIFSLTC